MSKYKNQESTGILTGYLDFPEEKIKVQVELWIEEIIFRGPPVTGGPIKVTIEGLMTTKEKAANG